MEAYRDQYATLFNNGRKVVVIGISADADTAQASWMRDADFPFLFLSDTRGVVGRLYGAWTGRVDNRSLFVIGPDGRIQHSQTPFREIDPTAYRELEAAIDRIAGGN